MTDAAPGSTVGAATSPTLAPSRILGWVNKPTQVGGGVLLAVLLVAMAGPAVAQEAAGWRVFTAEALRLEELLGYAATNEVSWIWHGLCYDPGLQAPGTRILWFIGISLILFVAVFTAIEATRKVTTDDGVRLTWRERRRARRLEARAQSSGDFLMSIPERWVRVYIPLAIIVFVLLFPFYWMTITAIKPDQQLVNLDAVNPYWVEGATMKHIHALLCLTNYDQWMWNTMLVAIVATFLSLVASVFAAYAIVRLRYRGSQSVGGAIFLAYLVPPSILFIPLSTMLSSYEVGGYKLWDTQWALILTYPTILIPFSTWLLMGYFKSIPFELEECALIDGASRWQILRKIVLPLAGPGLISAGIFGFTLCWNEFIYALTFISTPSNKTVPVAILSEMVDGDVYRWGSLMAGALFGSVPVALVYMFFVNHYVSAMTGAVKE